VGAKHSLALASLKRTAARLRSIISWLEDGDANTKLFHLHARHQKQKIFICKPESVTGYISNMMTRPWFWMNFLHKSDWFKHRPTTHYWSWFFGHRISWFNRIFVCGTLLICGLVWKTLFIMFLSVGHCNFMNLSVRHRTMSSRQKTLENNLSSIHRTCHVDQKHEITVSYR
jgi:hypothetical protein